MPLAARVPPSGRAWRRAPGQQDGAPSRLCHLAAHPGQRVRGRQEAIARWERIAAVIRRWSWQVCGRPISRLQQETGRCVGTRTAQLLLGGERQGSIDRASTFLCRKNQLRPKLFPRVGNAAVGHGVRAAATLAQTPVARRPHTTDYTLPAKLAPRCRRAGCQVTDSQTSTRMGVGLKPLHGLLIWGQLESTHSTSISARRST